ncbi:WG containing repeat [Pseudobutyrivibrio sp. NOR37]|uniref:WG repeat-containing protein n=1 Tax=Pseudobutyrivibrio xylanivorans TaxID=185007 RepID=A0A6M0LEL7_PSEXY|nr:MULTISPECIES: WG repeat-containing protein [Pseudobutyrivibrio]NEX01062.1 WG repeat-containing protein [Pseudobutyrivibrio xylanivorans]SFR64751.1 WG containing repeat [Pseudobutyrivibrio sp. NOR37]
MKSMKNNTIKKIIYGVAFVVVLVMMFFIHKGQKNVMKFFDVQKQKYVTISVKEDNPLRGNYTSLHTAAIGKYVDYGFTEDISFREPTFDVQNINGSLPIVFYNDSLNLYGYMDINGNILFEPQFYSADDFYSEGCARVRMTCYNEEGEKYVHPRSGVVNQRGEFIINPANPDESPFGLIIDPKYDLIFAEYYNGNGGQYFVYSLDGEKSQELTSDDFNNCVNRHFLQHMADYQYSINYDGLDDFVNQIDFGGQ